MDMTVAPHAGARIEMTDYGKKREEKESLPTRERGLKFGTNYSAEFPRRRSPRGSAD